MTAPHCTLVTAGSVPRVVDQAMRDRSLRPADRLAMYFLMDLLDVVQYTPVTSTGLAHVMGIEDQTAGRALRTLVERGYLDEKRIGGRSRAFRMPWSRRVTAARAA